jgi:hypothetical protein
LIKPVLEGLGYDTSDPNEVVPEFTCDFGIKQGEKVDFAIIENGKPKIIIECKHHKSSLDEVVLAQLHRYFTSSDAKLGILTNGILYRFYTDTEKPNIIDSEPFLEVDLSDPKKDVWGRLCHFSKEQYNSEKIRSMAIRLKRAAKIRNHLQSQLKAPSDSFIKFMIGELNLYPGKITEKIINQYKPAFDDAISMMAENRTANVSVNINANANANANAISNSLNIKNNNEVTLPCNLLGTKPEKLIFAGGEIIVKTWKEVLVKLAGEIYKRNKNSFSKVFSISSKKGCYFSDNPKQLRSAGSIADSGIFAETNLSADSIMKICRRLLSEFGYKETDISVITKSGG